jgi:hypothetical protein
VVPSRGQSKFLISLLRRELDRESEQLREAARRLNELEALHPELAAEAEEWSDASLVEEDNEFDPILFESQFREAQNLKSSKKQ